VHDALPDLVREQRLPHPESARGDRDRDHAPHEGREERVVPLRERRVEHLAEEERRNDSEPCCDEDERQDGAQTEPIWTEETDDPAGVRAPDCPVRRPLARLGKNLEVSHVVMV
jgi:hypothetical protein